MEHVWKKSGKSEEAHQRQSSDPSFGPLSRHPVTNSIDGSPLLAIQRQKLQTIFGNAVQFQQRDGRHVEPVDESSRWAGAAPFASKEPAQRMEDEEEKGPLQGKLTGTQPTEAGVGSASGPPEAKTAQRMAEEEEETMLQGKFEVAQRMEEDEEAKQPKRASDSPAQRQSDGAPPRNDTGLPDDLKSGVESLSGLSLDNVQVHYNSSGPAQVNALAYAQGSEIHVAPGQERHLPHEAWHVVQQAQGRVVPTGHAEGTPINDDQHLEREADVMGQRALQEESSGA